MGTIDSSTFRYKGAFCQLNILSSEQDMISLLPDLKIQKISPEISLRILTPWLVVHTDLYSHWYYRTVYLQGEFL